MGRHRRREHALTVTSSLCPCSSKGAPISADQGNARDEDRIRAIIDDRVEALRARDANALRSHDAPDILSYDVVNPLRYAGSDALQNRAESWISAFNGPVGCEIRDLGIAVGGDVAFAHSLNRVTGTTADGGTINMWARATVCFRKFDGAWLVTHEHTSVPFDPLTGSASLGLTP
jgi:ketosteroid isomerase-like protein